MRRAIVLALVAFAVGGCGLLFPAYPLSEDYSMPPPLALYRNGRATITLDDRTKVVLDRVGADSNLIETFGANVHWTGGDGWHLRVTGAASGMPFGPLAYLQLDRIADGQHLTIWDSSRCIVDIDRADESGVRGSATCKGLEWSDALSQPFPGPYPSPTPSTGGAGFDAEIEFEAFPAPNRA